MGPRNFLFLMRCAAGGDYDVFCFVVCDIESGSVTAAAERNSGSSSEMLVRFDSELSVDKHVIEPGCIGMGIRVGCVFGDFGGVEDDEVGGVSGFEKSPIGESERLSR